MLMLYLGSIETQEDRDKFEKLYVHYEKRMFAVSNKILNNEQDAEDIVHDTFQTLIENLDKINEIYSHKTWSYIVTIVKNKSINLYRKKARHGSVAFEEENILEQLFEKSLEEEIEAKNLKTKMAYFILKLPDRCRYVLYLHYYNGCSYAEIGKILEMTEANARQISRKARKMLETMIKESGILNE